jgi:hypothetical protein
MSRLLLSTTLIVSLLASPAFSADSFGLDDGSSFLRDSYSDNWDMSDNGDPLDFEIGIRYFYSIGSSALNVNGDDYSSSDQSHIVELHARIDDNSTDSYLKGRVGYAAAISGTYETPRFIGAQDMGAGRVAYAGADFGYMPFGSGDFRLGGFAGYQYMNESVDMGRSNYVDVEGNGASQNNSLEIHALKIGAVANADIGDMVDLRLEVAAIPYANLSGVYGAFSMPSYVSGGNVFIQGSEGQINGSLYGASGEAMIGFHPTDNLTIRIGGRASYLTGSGSMDFTARDIAGPQPVDPLDPLGDQIPAEAHNYTASVSGLEFFRYGALLEVTGRF